MKSRIQKITITIHTPKSLDLAVDKFIAVINDLGLEAVGVPQVFWQLSLFNKAPDALVIGKVRKSYGPKPRRDSSRKAS